MTWRQETEDMLHAKSLDEAGARNAARYGEEMHKLHLQIQTVKQNALALQDKLSDA